MSLLTLIATSDIHGRYLPDSRHTTGGSMASVASYVRSIRNDGADVLVLDCGDMLTDSPQAHCIGPGAEKLIQKAGYDAFCPGNHDLQLPLPSWLPCQPVVCNIILPDSYTGAIPRPYALFTCGNTRVAVTGVLTGETPLLPGGVSVTDPSEALEKVRNSLQSLHTKPHLTVLLIHAGKEEAKRIFTAAKWADIGIYGHDHSAAILKMPDNRLLANPGAFGRNFLKITFDTAAPSLTANAVAVTTDGIPPDSDMAIAADLIHGEINRTLGSISDSKQLISMLHKALHLATGAPLTSVTPPTHRVDTPNTITVEELYRMMPYDDYVSISLHSVRELREAGLDVCRHDSTQNVTDEDTPRTTASDTHSLFPTHGFIGISLQTLLAKLLVGQPLLH